MYIHYICICILYQAEDDDEDDEEESDDEVRKG